MGDQLEVKFEHAMAYFEAGDLARTQSACQSMLAATPEDADLHHLLGAALLQDGRPGEATEAFRRAGELAPDEAEIFGNLAVACEAAGDFEAAWGAYRRALDLGEREPEIFYGLASAAKLIGKLDDAAAAAEELVSAYPDHGPGWHLLAVSRMDVGDPAGAAEALERLLALAPNDAEARGNYAVVLAKLGRRDEARSEFEQVVAAPNVAAESLLNFGMMREEEKEEAEALALYRRAAELDEQSSSICECFAKLAKRCGKSAMVVEHLRGVVAGYPTLDFAWFYLAGAHLDSGDEEAARTAMARYFELDPEDRLGGNLVLGAGGAAALPGGPSTAFLQSFYRVRAGGWDKTVAEAYHGHDLVMAAFEGFLADGGKTDHVLDAGCGSGSLGARMKPLVGLLDGVDISPEMIAEARTKNVYDFLEIGDLFDVLSARPGRYDLIVAAAVLFHFRDLDAVLKPLAMALKPDGQAIFTLFKSADDDLHLNDQGFFEHGRGEVEAALKSASLAPVAIEEAIHEHNSDDEPRPCFCVRCCLDKPV